MGLSRMQGTSGYISYFGSNEGKRTRFNCDHYDRIAMCCCRNKTIQECESPGRCKYHTDYPYVYLKKEEVKKGRFEVSNEELNKRKKKKVAPIITTGSQVKVLNLNTSEKMQITIVDPREVNRAENKISRTSMLGKNLLGHKMGQTIEYRFDGKIERYRILNIK